MEWCSVTQAMTEEKPRSEDGTFTPEVTDADLLAVFEASEKPALTAGQVAKEVPIGRTAVTNRLNALHEEGRIERMDVGAKAVVWWPSE